MSRPAEILLVEDDETDVLLLRRAFKDVNATHTLQVATDGQDAIELLTRRGQSEPDRLPDLAIVDLKMPRKNGTDVLAWLRGQPALRCMPVMIFSSSGHRDDVEQAYALGANAFIIKPSSTVQRMEVARFISEWLKFNQRPLAVTEGFKAAYAWHATRDKAQ